MSEVAAPAAESSAAVSTPVVEETLSTAKVERNAETDPKESDTKPLTMKEKFLLKVDGQDIEEELDWNDKETIRNKLQLAAAAKKRMAESSEAKKKAFEIMKSFEDEASFEDFLSRHPKGREVAEKMLLKKIQEDMMSPEEKEHRATKAELEQFRKEKAEREAHLAKSAAEKKEFEYAQTFQNTIIEALNTSGLPKTPELVKRMAGLMSKNLELGLDLSPNELALEVKKELTDLVKALVGGADGDQLVGTFGDDLAKKIRMADVRKLQEKQAMFIQSKQNPMTAHNANKDGRTWTSIEEWKESLNDRIK